jgi:YgiT-type zinc finger domain-containing protein
MKPRAEQCTSCGASTEGRQVEHVIPGPRDVVRLEVQAEVCTRCGTRFFDRQTVIRFEEIRRKLAAGDVSAFTPMGHAYRA